MNERNVNQLRDEFYGFISTNVKADFLVFHFPTFHFFFSHSPNTFLCISIIEALPRNNRVWADGNGPGETWENVGSWEGLRGG